MRLRDERGQAIVLFALALSGMLVAVGLALDLGLAFQRTREMQNAADAAALAGARAVAKAGFATIARDITDFAEKNGAADPDGVAYDGVNANVTWTYVDNNENPVAQQYATGVRVEVAGNVTTHFLALAGIDTIPVARRSTALVERLTGQGAEAPFAVYEWQNNHAIDLLTHGANGVSGINPAAVGGTYLIHGPQVDDPFHPDDFKGLLPSGLLPVALGDSIPYEHGTRAGPTRDEVLAIGTQYMVLPIFDDAGAAAGLVHVVGFAVFDVQQTAANKHTGTLVSGQFLTNGTGARDWQQGSTFNVATLKLVR